jgi:hypothetical protein
MEGIEMSPSDISILVKVQRDTIQLRMHKSNTLQDVYTRIQDQFHLKPFTLMEGNVPLDLSLSVSMFHKKTLTVKLNAKTSHVRTSKLKTARSASRKIKNALRHSKLFLTQVCKVSGQCLALGRFTDELNSYFAYNTFKYMVESPQKEINAGGSGSIYEIEYNRNGYTSYAALKISLLGSDSLFYEYIIGRLFVNKITSQFPCFISTYGLYYGDYVGTQDLRSLELQKEVNYSTACERTEETSILIQHIANSKQILHYTRRPNPVFLKKDLLPILYIVYHALASLSTQFTHYDLSEQNVILLELPEPIEYVYENVRFCSKYVPKIIDYARSYFNNGKINSKHIYDTLCRTPECNQISPCGDEIGFGWLNPTPWAMISSQVKNESHDLRLLYSLGISRQTSGISWGVLDDLFPKVVYGQGVSPEKNQYGTIENLSTVPHKIVNVTDAKMELEALLLQHAPSSKKVAGRLVIRKGMPMEYVRL